MSAFGDDLRQRLIARSGPAAGPWWDGLPELTARPAVRWELRVGEPLGGGSTSVVLRCDRGVLKLTPEPALAAEEARELAATPTCRPCCCTATCTRATCSTAARAAASSPSTPARAPGPALRRGRLGALAARGRPRRPPRRPRGGRRGAPARLVRGLAAMIAASRINRGDRDVAWLLDLAA